jgi:formamidase
LDVRQLAAGSRVTFAVQVPGALLSVGDPHFAQGDGESGGTAIEMPASATLRVGLRKAGAVAWRPRYPTFEFHPLTHPGPHIGTTGIPAGDGGYLDVYSAAQEALSELVDMLIHERGLGESQAIALVGVASDLRISEIVNVPNPLVSAILPLDVFE